MSEPSLNEKLRDIRRDLLFIQTEVGELEDKLALAVETLEYYSNILHYRLAGFEDFVLRDEGSRALKALEKIKG